MDWAEVGPPGPTTQPDVVWVLAMDSLEIEVLGLVTAKASGSQGIMVLAGIVVVVLVYRLVMSKWKAR